MRNYYNEVARMYNLINRTGKPHFKMSNGEWARFKPNIVRIENNGVVMGAGGGGGGYYTTITKTPH